MTTPLVETHTAGLTDVPLLRRLVEHAIPLDNEYAYTSDARSTLTGVLLPARGQVTVIARGGQAPVIGQIKLRYDEPNAHVVYIAPGPECGADDTVWLHALDAMTREAGKLQAHNLVAEVEEKSPLFEILRTAGYAVYSRQHLWQRRGMYSAMPSRFKLHEEMQDDLMGVQALMGACIPRLVMPFAVPPGDMPRLVYRENHQVMAYVAYSTGKRGIYLLAYVHPDVIPDASHILDAALQMIAPASSNIPITFCIRRFQDWMSAPMERLGFAPGPQQALMVKHVAAGVRQTPFEALAEKLGRVNARASIPKHFNAILMPHPPVIGRSFPND